MRCHETGVKRARERAVKKCRKKRLDAVICLKRTDKQIIKKRLMTAFFIEARLNV
jgi:hypothetical protein